MPKFSGGVSLNVKNKGEKPYLRVKSGVQRDRYIHVMILEACIGRRLAPGEQVEHVDGDTLNNTYLPRYSERHFGNLMLMKDAAEHDRLTRARLAREREPGEEGEKSYEPRDESDDAIGRERGGAEGEGKGGGVCAREMEEAAIGGRESSGVSPPEMVE